MIIHSEAPIDSVRLGDVSGKIKIMRLIFSLNSMLSLGDITWSYEEITKCCGRGPSTEGRSIDTEKSSVPAR